MNVTPEIATVSVSLAVPMTVALLRFMPRRNAPGLATDLAAMSATLSHVQADIQEIKRDLRDLRRKVA